ncbi:MAG TPA: 2-amino-4-hydroxy-6-hydroxymethyldihydropteridine diphosphokinase [Candidatus Acidoferrales bacterium]|nr:2-amino-4-hydroxy-6-hydroxymethyldihydropteridine diphosphokinase [Candidatus Acidoferrales bacterium]
MRKTVYISLGSNVGDRETSLSEAVRRLSALGTVSHVSSLYETEPVEFLNQPWFLNCVVELQTEKMPRNLLSAVLEIERAMGRRRTVAKGPRTIDLDLLLFGSSVIDTPQLTVPHPSMHERRFVLEPLAEIAPDVRHPSLRRSAREMLSVLPKGSPTVRRFSAKSWPPVIENASS